MKIYPLHRSVFGDFEHDLSTGFRDDFKGGLNDFTHRLDYFKAGLENDLEIYLENERNDLLTDFEKQTSILEERIQNFTQAARNNAKIQNRIWIEQGGFALGFGIFMLIAISTSILIFARKKINKRKLRSNFSSLYKRSFHFTPVSDLYQNSDNGESP